VAADRQRRFTEVFRGHDLARGSLMRPAVRTSRYDPTMLESGVRPPPRGEDLPCSDGEPMETERHVEQYLLLISSLREEWKTRRDYYVGGNMFVYFSETQAKKNDFRGPDVFVVLDTPARERKSWVVWEEEGRTPDVVIEITSPSTERIDRGDKKRIYARLLHVGEYYLYDPFTYALEGFLLDRAGRVYIPRELDTEGRLRSPALGLSLGVVPTKRGNVDAPMLRWIRPDGTVVPQGEEHIEAARRFADDAERKADEAERKADEAERKADEAERKADEAERKADEATRKADDMIRKAAEETRRADAASDENATLRAELDRLRAAGNKP
jgi:Uma2 family endonuclease